MLKTILILSVCMICFACTVGPDYEAPRFFKENGHITSQDLSRKYKITKNWYRQFDDEQLNSLIEIGLKQNTDIGQAAAKIKQARATLAINESDFLPLIDASGSYNYEKYHNNTGSNLEYYSAGFDASWELDFWGKGRRQKEADFANVKQMEFSLDNIKTMVVAEIIMQYISLLQNSENLRLARQNLQLQQQIYDTVFFKYRNGLTDATDYQQARYLVATTKAQIPLYENNIEKYKNSLSVICGTLPEKFFIETHRKADLFAKTKIFNDNGLTELPLQIIRLRPDVAAAEQKLIAQNALIGKAVAELYPDISVSGMWGYMAANTNNLFNSSSQEYKYAPIVSLPILDWNKFKNNVKLQKYIKEEALENYKKTVLTAAAELKNAMVNFTLAKKQFQNQSEALNSMKRAVDASMRQYQNGLIGFSDVLSIQQNYIGAQNDFSASKAKVFEAVVAYYKAAGGGMYQEN